MIRGKEGIGWNWRVCDEGSLRFPTESLKSFEMKNLSFDRNC